jgi:hypothetical protein
LTRKLTIEEVRKNLNDNGYTLLSNEYINANTKIKVRCPNGHEYDVVIGSFNSGRRCGTCAGLTKYSIDYVRSYFEENGCILLTDVYTDNKGKLKYICKCGNQSETDFHRFIHGNRCKKCRSNTVGEKKRLPFEDVRKYFEENGCTLLSTEYTNAHQMLRYVCSCNNIWEATLNTFKYTNGRCKECRYKKAKETMYKNGTAPCSKQQKYICNLLSGELNYPQGKLNLDIAFPDKSIYIEYDGGMHKGQVFFGNMSEKEFNDYERKRYWTLKRKGWKMIKIISEKDFLPSDDMIKTMYNDAINLIDKGENWVSFNIDSKIVSTYESVNEYDFGNLRKIRA